MLNTTHDAVRAMLKADPSMTPADRSRIIAAIRSHGKADEDATPATPEPRIIRRAAVAARLGVGLRCVDNWNRVGILKKVTMPGRIRAAGFRESDVVALIAGGQK